MLRLIRYLGKLADTIFHLGIKSVVRKYMYPESEATVLDDTGLDITRVNIPFEIMNRDPATADLTSHIALWFGPKTCVANVPVQRGKSLPTRFSAVRIVKV
jgi:hypothetical protein